MTYANRDSGVLAKQNRFNATINPDNNSLYMIYGSYVEHGVRRMVRGTRIVIVFFYQIEITLQRLVQVWSRKPEQCQVCCQCFSSEKALESHYPRCTGAPLYSRFKVEKTNRESDKIEAVEVQESNDNVDDEVNQSSEEHAEEVVKQSTESDDEVVVVSTQKGVPNFIIKKVKESVYLVTSCRRRDTSIEKSVNSGDGPTYVIEIL